MRVLITGAQGFIGRYLVAHLLRASAETRVFGVGRSAPDQTSFTHVISLRGRTSSAPLPPTVAEAARSPRYSYQPLDLLEVAALTEHVRTIAPDRIIHLASGLRGDPTEFLLRTNVLGTENLYVAVAGSGLPAPSILIGSSGSVYGVVGDADLPVTEQRPPAPFDMYSITKAAQESVARMLAARFAIPTTIARIFAVVGPGQDERHVCGRIASQIAAIERSDAATITIGPMTATRDFVDVRDVAEALATIVARGQPGATYNVGSGQETPIQDVYDTLVSLASAPVPRAEAQVSTRPIDMPRNVADISRLLGLGMQPRFDVRQSLSDVLDYYRSV